MNKTKLYEILLIVRQSMLINEVELLIDKLSSIIKDKDGLVNLIKNCGVRDFAYLVKGEDKGYYIIMNITSSSTSLREMERVMHLNDNLLRFLTVKVKKHDQRSSFLFNDSSWKDEESLRLMD